MALKVVLDACVLFSAPLRDTLLRAQNANLYDLLLTNDILEELRRNLLKRQTAIGAEAERRVSRLLSVLRQGFAGNIAANYEALIQSMPINHKDRHVMAAALANDAQIIVTHNLKDFPTHLLAPYRLKAQSPDQFLLLLFSTHTQTMKDLLEEQAAFLRNPPMTIAEVLDRLALDAPYFASLARQTFKC